MEQETNEQVAEQVANASYGARLGNAFKTMYSKTAYTFIGVSLFCLYIIFFKLDEKTGGSFTMRIFTFIFCVLVGGLIGMGVGSKQLEASTKSFRMGAGTLLMITTLLSWSNTGYVSPYSSGSSEKCLECGGSISGKGWSTVGGEQFQGDTQGYYCSKTCAYDSQSTKWK